jgi:hypothetical protein
MRYPPAAAVAPQPLNAPATTTSLPSGPEADGSTKVWTAQASAAQTWSAQSWTASAQSVADSQAVPASDGNSASTVCLYSSRFSSRTRRARHRRPVGRARRRRGPVAAR